MRDRLILFFAVALTGVVMLSWSSGDFGASPAAASASAITSEVNPTVVGPGPGPGPNPPPTVCPFVPMPGVGTLAPVLNFVISVFTTPPGQPINMATPYYNVDTHLIRIDESGEAFVWAQNCDGVRKWIPWGGAKPDPKQFEQQVKVRASEGIEPPGAAINPVGRAPVNLGLWLAARPFPTQTAIAQSPDGALWWRVDATTADVTFDMGNGDRRTCTVWDREYQDSDDTRGESPDCGYTYRGTEVVDRTDLVITVVARYRLSWSNSNGGSGDYPPSDDVCVTTMVPYDVYELKTVPGSGSTTTFPPAPPPIPLNDVYSCPNFLPPRG